MKAKPLSVKIRRALVQAEHFANQLAFGESEEYYMKWADYFRALADGKKCVEPKDEA